MSNKQEKVEVVTDFLFFSYNITADGDCSHAIRRWLLLSRKAMTNIVCWKAEVLLCQQRSIESRLWSSQWSYTVCESWTVKKAECQRIVAFELWFWRRLLKIPWRARRSNQSILRKTNPEYSLEGLMLKLKLQYFSYLIQTDESLEKSLRKIEGREEDIRRWDGWTASPMQWTWNWVNPGRWWGTGIPGMLQSKRLQRVGHDWATEQQQQWVVTCHSEYNTTLLE